MLTPRLRLAVFIAVFFLPLLTAQAAPQSPADIFGFQPGDDYKLASYEQMEVYYRQLAEQSNRVQLREIGRSALGRTLYVLTISSPDNLANLEKYRSISEQLARARVDSDTAVQLANDGKAIVWIDAGLHATELAHGQMAPQLAHRVATEDTAEMQQIREDVIFLLMPMMNPDGLEIVRKWYDSQIGTRFERTNPPELYHHYVGHDNNRDFFMNNMPESKAVAKVVYNEWYPQIVYNQHQISPPWARIVVPPYSDPVNPIIHPGVTTGLNEIGSAMGNRFALQNMPGAISDVGFSMWWNGGMRTVPYFHNMIGILTETGHNCQIPGYYDPKLFPRMRALRGNPGAVGEDLDEELDGVPDATVLYPYPWSGGESHFSEPVNYMITASVAVLRAASDSRVKWLTNIHRMGQDAIAAGQSGTRYYVIPAGQRHDDEAHNLVNVLLEGGVEVSQSTAAFRAGGKRYPAGSFIVAAAQAFRPYVIDLLEKQVYPDTRLDPTGAAKAPYDISGWTLPMQMGVVVDFVSDDVNADTEAVAEHVSLPAGDVGSNARFGYALSHEMNVSIKAVNRLLRAGERVSWSDAAFRAGRRDFAVGTFVIEQGERTEERVQSVAAEMGIDFTAMNSQPDSDLFALRLPRVGLYKSYIGAMDEGWTRWLLEEYGFDLVSLHDSDLRPVNLANLDAIIIPHPDARVSFASNVEKILTGHPEGSMPDEYTGGMGLEGALAIQQFVREGGTLLTFGAANDFAIGVFGLPVRNLVAGASRETYSVPGTLVRSSVANSDPLAYGMPKSISVTVVGGAAFGVRGQEGCIDELLNQSHCAELTRGGRLLTEHTQPTVYDSIVSYASEDLLMSGWAKGLQHIEGETAMARVSHGAGEVIVFGFRPQFRGQPRGTYKLVFNALHSATIDVMR